MLLSGGVGTFHRSETSLATSLADSRSLDPKTPFFTSCEAIELAETGHGRYEWRDLPVRLLIILHALRLECEKSMDWTASSQRSLLFSSSLESKVVAAWLDSSVPEGACKKEW